MDNKRYVHKVYSIFDLADCEGLLVPQGAGGRVMYVYDKEENRREFRFLGRKVAEEVESKIIVWLEQNIEQCKAL
jgi:hypothetical protein